MDDLSQQADEIEALSSIYGSDWSTDDESSRSYKTTIRGAHVVTLHLKLPVDYPSSSPPEFQISAPTLARDEKQRITDELNEIYLENIGEPVIFQWIEKIREGLETVAENDDDVEEIGDVVDAGEERRPDVDIVHGPLIEDRRSTFQGHVVVVHSKDDVDHALDALKRNRKIAQATHNILAYRIKIGHEKNILQDCDDDGETHAGRRLLQLLNVLDIVDVAVVVTRWYGGIHLGPDRFRHINNAAREVLEAADLIKTK